MIDLTEKPYERPAFHTAPSPRLKVGGHNEQSNSHLFSVKTTTSIIDDRSCISSETFASLIEQQQARLNEIHLGRGERVVVYGPKSASYCALLLAIFAVGAVAVPVYPGLKLTQLQHIFANCSPKAAFVGPYALGKLREQSFTANIVLQEIKAESKCRSHHECLAHPIPAEADAAIIYTSGSTGMPKGVVFSRRNMLLSARSVAQYTGLDSSDCILCALPFSFDAGLFGFLSALVAGAKIVLVDFVHPVQLVALCRRWNVTSITAVPGLWSKIATADWSSVGESIKRLSNTGGHLHAALNKKLEAHFPGATIYPMYGFTEAFRCTYMPPDRAKLKPGSVGRSIPYSSFAIVSEDGQLCAANEVGELVQFGPLVTKGYWGNEPESQMKFRPVPTSVTDGLMSTAGDIYHADPAHFGRTVWSGDLARIDEDGDLYFIRRRDGMMKVNGFRVSPTEIEETCIRRGCMAAFAFMVPLDGNDVLVVAFATDREISTSQLGSALCADLPTYMLPKHLLALEDLPINDNGKFCRTTIQNIVMRQLEQKS